MNIREHEDYTNFKTEAFTELKVFIVKNNKVNPRDAIRLLYQPTEIEIQEFQSLLDGSRRERASSCSDITDDGCSSDEGLSISAQMKAKLEDTSDDKNDYLFYVMTGISGGILGGKTDVELNMNKGLKVIFLLLH